MTAVPKRVTIKTACRLLHCANRRQLALRLSATSQTVDYWHNTLGGKLPSLWRDRVELILLKEERTNGVAVLGS